MFENLGDRRLQFFQIALTGRAAEQLGKLSLRSLQRLDDGFQNGCRINQAQEIGETFFGYGTDVDGRLAARLSAQTGQIALLLTKLGRLLAEGGTGEKSRLRFAGEERQTVRLRHDLAQGIEHQSLRLVGQAVLHDACDLLRRGASHHIVARRSAS